MRTAIVTGAGYLVAQWLFLPPQGVVQGLLLALALGLLTGVIVGVARAWKQ